MKIRILILTLLILTCRTLWAQKYYIPDPAFRSCLIEDFPQVFDGGDSLIISAASTLPGQIHCNVKGIESVDGIQYFKSISMIDLDSNKIKSFPPLNGFTNLTDITFTDNILESIPDLRNIPTLKSVVLHGNKLTTLPDFTGLANLNFFSAISNPIVNMPDFTGTKLNQLYFNSTNISEIHSSVLSNQPNLKILAIRWCFFDTLPDLSELSLTSLRVEHNYLTYSDLLPVINSPNRNALVLDQDMRNISLASKGGSIENDKLEFVFPGDEGLSSNSYTWYLNDQIKAVTTENRLVIENAKPEHTGVWRCEVTNNDTYFDGKNFKLNSTLVNVNVIPCFDGSQLSFQVDKVDCINGDQVSVLPAFLKNYIPPLSSELTHLKSGQVKHSGNLTFNNLQDGSYLLTVKDANGCIFKPTTQLNVNRDTSCDDVFTPNGDGQNDIFYFTLNGKVSVFNINNELIRQIDNNINFWDGKDDKSMIVNTGYFALVDEQGEVVYVTVLR